MTDFVDTFHDRLELSSRISVIIWSDTRFALKQRLSNLLSLAALCHLLVKFDDGFVHFSHGALDFTKLRRPVITGTSRTLSATAGPSVQISAFIRLKLTMQMLIELDLLVKLLQIGKLVVVLGGFFHSTLLYP